MKKITDLYRYFTEDILVQVDLHAKAEIVEFLEEYKEAFKGKETKEELGISYQGEYREDTDIKEGKGIIILKDWTVYLG
jgi:hypothetical protein